MGRGRFVLGGGFIFEKWWVVFGLFWVVLGSGRFILSCGG